MQSLEDEYERTLQDEAKELEQLLSKRNMLLAKQEEYSKKIRELGPLSSDAFDTYYLIFFFSWLDLFYFVSDSKFALCLMFSEWYSCLELFRFFLPKLEKYLIKIRELVYCHQMLLKCILCICSFSFFHFSSWMLLLSLSLKFPFFNVFW